jgi:hypothetical protein
MRAFLEQNWLIYQSFLIEKWSSRQRSFATVYSICHFHYSALPLPCYRLPFIKQSPKCLFITLSMYKSPQIFFFFIGLSTFFVHNSLQQNQKLLVFSKMSQMIPMVRVIIEPS